MGFIRFLNDIIVKSDSFKKKLYASLKLSEEAIDNGELRYSSSTTKEEIVKIAETWVYQLPTREDCQFVFSDENKALETVKKQIFSKYLNDDRAWRYFLQHRDEDGFYTEDLQVFLSLNYHFFLATERHRVIWRHCYEKRSVHKVIIDESL